MGKRRENAGQLQRGRPRTSDGPLENIGRADCLHRVEQDTADAAENGEDRGEDDGGDKQLLVGLLVGQTEHAQGVGDGLGMRQGVEGLRGAQQQTGAERPR